MILCTVDKINLSYGEKSIFNNASLIINKGDRIGLLGLNGSGKSTLFKILNEEVTPDINENKFTFDKAKGLDEQSFSCFLVPQEPKIPTENNLLIKDYYLIYRPRLLNHHKNLKLINQELEKNQNNELLERQKETLDLIEQEKGWEIQYKYCSYLKQFNIDENKNIKDTSGGELKKCLLAIGLSAPESIILWDEPTNHLDIDAIKRLEDELNSSEKTFILISHDRHLLSKVVNQIFKIEHGKINKYKGDYTDYLRYLSEEEAKITAKLDKLNNSLRRETAWMRQGVKARGTRSKKRVENFHELNDKISEIKNKIRKKLDLTINSSQRKTKTLIDCKMINLNRGEKKIIENSDFMVCKGDKIGIVGKNGVGKTSLVKLINNDLDLQSGSIKRANDINIKLFDQKREDIPLELTAYEYVGDGEDFIHLPSGQRMHVTGYLQNFNFKKEEIKRPIKTFSGGERNRLQLAKNLTYAADLWIFDEPTNDLDLETVEILEGILSDFKGSVIIISHDRHFLNNTTNKTWLLKDMKLEQFNGGHQQLEEYLDALYVEDNYFKRNEKKQNQENSDSSPQAVKTKATNKQKIRYKELPNIIEKYENSISKLTDKLESTDYQNLNQDEIKELSEKTQERDKMEEELLALYEEYEEIKDLIEN